MSLERTGDVSEEHRMKGAHPTYAETTFESGLKYRKGEKYSSCDALDNQTRSVENGPRRRDTEVKINRYG